MCRGSEHDFDGLKSCVILCRSGPLAVIRSDLFGAEGVGLFAEVHITILMGWEVGSAINYFELKVSGCVQGGRARF